MRNAGNISVVIPVRNGEVTLGRCLKSIVEQNESLCEIIILDSESTDHSIIIAKQYGAQVHNIPIASFNHGLTRNIGVHHASGDLIFFTVQDAWLADQNILSKMAAHFDDPGVMAVVGHQAVPHEKDTNPVLWFRRFSKPTVTARKLNDSEKLSEMSQARQQELVAWDNVVAMYRKTALLELPFVETQFAEDWIWSAAALEKGWTLLHDPSLVAWHYHHYNFNYAFQVAYAVNYHFYKFLGYKPGVPALVIPMVKAVWQLLKNSRLTLKEKWYWINHNCQRLFGTWLSHLDILWRLKTGGAKALDKGYQKYNKQVPQGTQKR